MLVNIRSILPGPGDSKVDLDEPRAIVRFFSKYDARLLCPKRGWTAFLLIDCPAALRLIYAGQNCKREEAIQSLRLCQPETIVKI